MSDKTKTPPLRWGIVGAGTVSHDFVCALSTLPPEEHKVVAVAARGTENAVKFAKNHEIPVHYADHEALARDPNVEIVYIGTKNTTHYEICVMMLDFNKHILCEKPLCVNAGQAKILLDCARNKNLFCMEGMWSRFFPAYSHLRDRIKEENVGDIKEINMELGYPISKVERIRMGHLTHGAVVLELGVYNIQLALLAFRTYPEEVTVERKVNKENVDIEMTVKLRFPGGGVSNMKISGVEKLSNEALIIGSAGRITLYDFQCPVKLLDVDGQIRTFPLPPSNVECILKNSVGMRYEADECRQRIRAGEVESPLMRHKDTLDVARVLDEIRKQLGDECAEDLMFPMT